MDVMIDLETMSTRPNAAILQIGAVAFNPQRPSLRREDPEFIVTLPLQDSLLKGLHVDVGKTAQWWAKEAPSAAREAICRVDCARLESSLIELAEMLSGVLGEHGHLWSHGAAFDVPILESAFHACGLPVPWAYKNVRDTRTLFDIARAAGWERPDSKAPTAHTALEDAIEQALAVQSATVWLTSKARITEERVGEISQRTTVIDPGLIGLAQTHVEEGQTETIRDPGP